MLLWYCAHVQGIADMAEATQATPLSEDPKATEQGLGQPVTYCHVIKDANYFTENMAKGELKVWANMTFWDRQVPNSPENQLQDVYEQQGNKQWLDWVGLPGLFNLKPHLLNSQPDSNVAAMFGQKYTVGITQFQL